MKILASTIITLQVLCTILLAVLIINPQQQSEVAGTEKLTIQFESQLEELQEVSKKLSIAVNDSSFEKGREPSISFANYEFLRDGELAFTEAEIEQIRSNVVPAFIEWANHEGYDVIGIYIVQDENQETLIGLQSALFEKSTNNFRYYQAEAILNDEGQFKFSPDAGINYRG